MDVYRATRSAPTTRPCETTRQATTALRLHLRSNTGLIRWRALYRANKGATLARLGQNTQRLANVAED